jgi:hypothetical protein
MMWDLLGVSIEQRKEALSRGTGGTLLDSRRRSLDEPSLSFFSPERLARTWEIIYLPIQVLHTT